MDIVDMTENEDGSLTIEVTLTEDENRFLVEYAIVDILKGYIEEQEGTS